MTLSLVIPAHNEESRIEATVRQYTERYPETEIIVVCNGCTDNTTEIVSKMNVQNGKIILLNFTERIGKGGAIREGFKIAKNEIIGFVDADESTAPEELAKLIAALPGNDGAIASRKLKESLVPIKQPPIRRMGSQAFNMLVRVMFGLKFKDTQCGAKLFRKEAIMDVLPQLKTSGFEFDVELLWKLQLKGYCVVEVPITWKHAAGSTFHLTQAPLMFYSLLKVRLFPEFTN